MRQSVVGPSEGKHYKLFPKAFAFAALLGKKSASGTINRPLQSNRMPSCRWHALAVAI